MSRLRAGRHGGPGSDVTYYANLLRVQRPRLLHRIVGAANG
jgi:hypothetical protein